MISLPLFQVAAFADQAFAGNPAAVVVLEHPLDSDALQRIARETAQPATAFLCKQDQQWTIRWFTPNVELPICGHGSLAAAYVLFERLAAADSTIILQHHRAGALSVVREQGRIWLDFPANPAQELSHQTAVQALLGNRCLTVLQTETNYIAILPSANEVRQWQPDFAAISALDRSGFAISARADSTNGNEINCVSRYFAPRKGVPEDAVTGSVHCTLVPYWSAILGKNTIRAQQASARGGVLDCELTPGRVRISGACVLFLEGSIAIDERHSQ